MDPAFTGTGRVAQGGLGCRWNWPGPPRPGTNSVLAVSDNLTVLLWRQRLAGVAGGASHKKVSRNFNWIWYLGAAVWFLNAALAMYHGKLRLGLTNAAISAVFLAAGIFFGKQTKRRPVAATAGGR